MTQEEKNLLLQDLCARLLYGVIIQVYFEDIAGSGYFDEKAESIDIDPYCPHVNDRWIENIKPYLRPMSSMTEEERTEAEDLNMNPFSGSVTDWLNKNKFDYRDLIPMGLALKAPKNMYEF